MYESPISTYIEHVAHDLATDMNKKQKEYVYGQVMRLGIDIDKDELIKALNYDRDQYEKGYKDGYDDGYEKGKNDVIAKMIEYIQNQ